MPKFAVITEWLLIHRGPRRRTIGRRARAARFVAASLLFAYLVGGCGSDDDPPAVADDPPTVPIPTQAPSPAPGCDESKRFAVDFRAETFAELGVIDTLSGCTDGVSTMIKNAEDSTVIWVIDEPPLQWNYPSSSVRFALFRATLAQRGWDGGLALEPGASVSFDHPPESVHLRLDPALMVAWEYQQPVVDEVVAKAKANAPDVLGGSRPWRRAAIACGIAGYDVGSSVRDLGIEDNREALSYMSTGKSVVDSIKPCHRRLREADEADESKRWQLTRQSVVSRTEVIAADEAADAAYKAAQYRTVAKALRALWP